MPLDLSTFHQKIQAYPEAYLLPEEEQALTMILETLEGLFGSPISHLSHASRMQLVRDVVQVCVSVTRQQ